MIQRPHIPHQLAIKRVAPHRVIDVVERVLHHVVRIQLVDLLEDRVHIRLRRLRKDQELRTGQRLEALQSEVLGLEDFNARGGFGAVQK